MDFVHLNTKYVKGVMEYNYTILLIILSFDVDL